jgi:hypothetical protein
LDTIHMKISRSLGVGLAFTVVLLLHAELHEWAHVLPGAAICGAFGERDFNSWSLAEGCTSVVPTMLGPLFTFAVAYGAAWAIHRGTAASRPLFLLVLASTTLFGRLVTVALGGGDELVVLRSTLPTHALPYARPIGLLLLVALSAWPALVAYRALGRRVGVLAMWAVIPFVLLAFFVLFGLNGLLTISLLARPLILGSPPAVHLYTAVLLLLVPLAWRTLRPGAR